MKRANAAWAAVAAGAAALMGPWGCGPSPEGAPRSARALETAWMAPARLDAVEFAADGVTVSGAATPGERVVLANPAGVSAAATSGADGRFSIRLRPPQAAELYRIEIHGGREEARAGSWLILAPEPAPVAAMLTAGDVTVPLTGSNLLSSLDYDGAGLLVSGAADPGQAVRVSLDDGPAQSVLAGADGRYVARFASIPPGPRRVRAEEGERAQSVLLTLTRPTGEMAVNGFGAGAHIDWPTPGGGGQGAWIIGGASGAE